MTRSRRCRPIGGARICRANPGHDRTRRSDAQCSASEISRIMPRPGTYRFVDVDRCNMCCSGVEHQQFIGRRLDHPQGLWPERKPGITTSIFRCRVCSLIYANPLPFPEDLGQHYDVAPEDYWTEAHFAVPSDYLAHQVKTFERL